MVGLGPSAFLTGDQPCQQRARVDHVGCDEGAARRQHPNRSRQKAGAHNA